MCLPWCSKRTRASSSSTKSDSDSVNEILCKRITTLEMAPGNRSVQPSPKEIRNFRGQEFSSDSIHGGIQIKSSYFDVNEKSTNPINRCNVRILSTKFDNKNITKSKIIKGNKRFEQLIQQKIKFLDKLYDKVYTAHRSAGSSASSLSLQDSSTSISSKASKMDMVKYSILPMAKNKSKMQIKDKNVYKKLKQLTLKYSLSKLKPNQSLDGKISSNVNVNDDNVNNNSNIGSSLNMNTSICSSEFTESPEKNNFNGRANKSSTQRSRERKKEHSTEMVSNTEAKLFTSNKSISSSGLSKSSSLKQGKSMLKLRPLLEKSKQYGKLDSMQIFAEHHKKYIDPYDSDDEYEDDDVSDTNQMD